MPDNKLYVIDLAANPPKLIDTVTVGQQPSGLTINRRGDLALIANRAGKSISVVSISGATVRAVGAVPLGQKAADVAITPDGRPTDARRQARVRGDEPRQQGGRARHRRSDRDV